MAVDILLGLQWGDEGKGKVVDVFTPHYDIVARFQGGPNAGHTIIFNDQKFVLHLIPSGIFHPHIQCLIGNGVVIDPMTLKREIEQLEQTGISVRDHLLISQRAHLIMPTHKFLDQASEKAKGDKKIGSTLRGIGPTYMDKTGRNGVRVGNVLTRDFYTQYTALRDKHMELLKKLYDFEVDIQQEEQNFLESIEFLKQLQLINSEAFLYDQISQNKKILAEGAQGTLLDLEFGSYPYVTSSNTTASGACSGLGIPPSSIRSVYGIFKAYCTRVGSGPFPTELHDGMGEQIRKVGSEFGATTGRPRRCGWLDLPLLKYAVRLNSITDLIMTKADVLSLLPHIQVCTQYNYKGKCNDEVPFDLELADLNPVYTTLEGWEQDITGITQAQDLPQKLAHYIEFIEQTLSVPVTYLSVGPDRNQIIELSR